MAQLYEHQITDLKARLITDKKKTEQQADQIINLAQREAVIKLLKKEISILKGAFAKSKAKNQDLKNQIMNTAEKENSNINFSVSNSLSTKHSTSRKTLQKPSTTTSSSRYLNNTAEDDQHHLASLDKNVIRLAQLLLL